MESDLSNWKGCSLPQKKIMEGRYVRLEPLEAKKHGDEMYNVAIEEGSEERMRYLWVTLPKSRQEFQEFMEGCEKNEDLLYFVVVDKKTGKVGGRQTFLHINAAHGVVEVGGMLRGSLISRKPASTEAIYLFLQHLFDELGYRRVEWKCHADNHASARTAARCGFKYEGLFRQHYVMKGKNRDSKYFSIIDKEWPEIKTAFEQWLGPENFDANGGQKRKLESFHTHNK